MVLDLSLHHAPTDRCDASQTTTTASVSFAGAISRDWSHILNASNLHAGSSQSPQGALSTRAGTLGLCTTGGPELDVECRDAQLLASRSDILGGQHGCIWRGLVAISLHLHTTGDPHERLTARDICDMDECVVERSKHMGNTKDILTLADLRPEGDCLHLFLRLGCHSSSGQLTFASKE